MRYPVRRVLIVFSLLSASIAGSATGGSPADAASNLRSGFSDSFVAGGFNSPTAVEALPDGRVVVLEKVGRVRILRGSTVVANPALAIALGDCDSGEQGFLGFAVDSSFMLNRYVYLYYTRPKGGACVNRVSRFTFNPGTDVINASSELVLLDNIPGTETDGGSNHNGGDIEIGADGLLYVAVGDSGSDPRGDSGSGGGNDAAMDLGLLSGKIVRIGTNGSTPGTNPYASAGNRVSCRSTGASSTTVGKVCQEIYAYGLRNPYRFAFDPNTSNVRFFINDVGQGTREEVNNGVLGANYGWNNREGRCPQGQNPPCAGPGAGQTDPVTDYGRGYGSYITGGAFIPNGAWPAAYDGGYLFADGGSGRIFFRPSGGAVDYDAPFATSAGVVGHMTFVPAGDRWSLYYTDNGDGTLRKITYNTSAASSVGNLVFDSVSPKRVYDTRDNTGGGGTGLLLGGNGRLINAQAPTGAAAALVNITMTSVRGPGFVQTWLPRSSIPSTSVHNSPGSGTAANAVVVPLDSAGRFNMRTSVSTHLVVDVLGYYSPAAGASDPNGRYHAVTAGRLIDSRQPSGTTLTSGSTNPYAVAGDHFDVQVNGQLDVPSSGAKAVAVMVTAYGAAGSSGFATIYPNGLARPLASNVNTNSGGDARGNLAIVPIGSGGKVSVYLNPGVVDVTVDVIGWVGAAGGPAYSNGALTLIAPARPVDTRTPLGFNRLSAGATGTRDMTPPLPSNAEVVLQNVTTTRVSGAGVLTAFPAGTTRPAIDTTRSSASGQTRPAMTLTELSSGDQVSFYASVATDVVVDVFGYFN